MLALYPMDVIRVMVALDTMVTMGAMMGTRVGVKGTKDVQEGIFVL